MRGILVRVVAVGAGVVVGLLLLEVPARFSAPDFTRAAFRDRSAEFYWPAPDRRHPWTRATDEPLRIAIVGDSFAYGVGVQPDDRYGARLERLLNLNPGLRPVEVEVFALSGSSTFQQYHLLKGALEWHAEIVVLGITLNDPENWSRVRELASWREAMFMRPPPAWLEPLVRHSSGVRWVYTRLEGHRMRGAFLEYYKRLYTPQYSGWERFVHAVELYRNDCEQAGVRFSVVIFPLFSFGFDQAYPMRFAHRRIHRQLDDLHVSYLDLLDRYEGSNAVRLEVIPGVDPHPNEIAHRIAAEALLEFLLRQNYLPREYRPVRRDAKLVGQWREQVLDREFARQP